MNQRNVHFLEFNGKKIYFFRINGVYWIIVKSVCESLSVDYIRQFKNMQEDRILAPRLSKQTILVPGDTQPRKYVCIPEKYVYGWIFSIKSDSEDLWNYKEDCYEVLFNNFHGKITRQAELYSELSKNRKIAAELEKTLKDNPDFQAWGQAKMQVMRLWKNIKTNSNMDMDDLFENENL